LNTISQAVTAVLFKEKNSKFYGFLFPIQAEKQIKDLIVEVKNELPGANHYCYAYRLRGTNDSLTFRSSDDGEPSGTAGQPIYGQLLSTDLVNVLCVVVRFFGGVKLGTGGLITAYRESARLTIAEASVVVFEPKSHFQFSGPFSQESVMYRLVKKVDGEVTKKSADSLLTIDFSVKTTEVENLKSVFSAYNHLLNLVEIS
jgi:uncharacterized YigZ family protein